MTSALRREGELAQKQTDMLYKWDSDKGAPGRGSEKPQIFADITCERSQAGRKGGRMGGVSPTLKGLLDRKIMWSEWASEGGREWAKETEHAKAKRK